MKLETGYVYHIKNEYFDFVDDPKLMKNHENDATRPNYFCIKEEGSPLMWFIPMSSKVEKYKTIIKNKFSKYGRCDTIVIGNYRNRDAVFLIQNMFPITAEYIDHVDTADGLITKVARETTNEILKKVDFVLELKKHEVNLVFPDVDAIASKLLHRD